jgi:hypothetical protein
MAQKTKEYGKFTLRKDNRAVMDTPHLERIKASIQAKNMLHLAPIIVNEKMEILDGQHRYFAAKDLGLEIWYEVHKDKDSHDIVLLNVNKPWSYADYLNYFVVNKHPEYVKFNDFLRKNQLTIALGMKMVYGRGHTVRDDFKMGKLKFNPEDMDGVIDVCKDTVAIIKANHGNSSWTGSTKFWLPMCQLAVTAGFDKDKWFRNLKAMVTTITNQLKQEDFFKLLQGIYNNPILNQEENKQKILGSYDI